MSTPELFPQISFSTIATITRSNLLVIFGVVLVVFIFFTAVFLFHWRTYGRGNKYIFMAEVIYWAISLFLLMSMVITVMLY